MATWSTVVTTRSRMSRRSFLCRADVRPTKRARYASSTVVQLPTLLQLKQTLRELTALLPRLEHSRAQAWQRRLQWTLEDLSKRRKGHIAVLGDSQSGASYVVSALLEDPHSGDQANRRRLRARTAPTPTRFIRHQEGSLPPVDNGDELLLSSPFLARAGVDLVEADAAPSEEPQDRESDILYQADHILLVIDDVRGTEPVRHLIAQGARQLGHLILVENRILGQQGVVAQEVEAMFEGLRGEAFPELPWTTGVNARQAIRALDGLRERGKTDPSVYRRMFAASGIIDVGEAVLSLPTTAMAEPAGEAPAPYQLRTAAFTAESCASDAVVASANALLDLDTVAGRIAELASSCEQAKRNILAALECTEEGMHLPEASLDEARQAVQHIFRHRIHWYKLPFGRVDDVRTELTAIVENAFLRTLEARLYYDAGRLQAFAAPALFHTDALLASPPFRPDGPLHSSILVNAIAQVAARPPLPPDTLAKNVVARRRLLTTKGGPLDAVQRRAQLGVLRFYALNFVSAGLGVLGWLDGFATAPTAVGIGALGATVASWSLARGWSKAEQRLLADWRRVENGLAFDLKATLERALDEVVFAKPDAAARGLAELVSSRRQETIEAEAAARDILHKATELRKSLTVQVAHGAK